MLLFVLILIFTGLWAVLNVGVVFCEIFDPLPGFTSSDLKRYHLFIPGFILGVYIHDHAKKSFKVKEFWSKPLFKKEN